VVKKIEGTADEREWCAGLHKIKKPPGRQAADGEKPKGQGARGRRTTARVWNNIPYTGYGIALAIYIYISI
jgi:hypothetical protein